MNSIDVYLNLAYKPIGFRIARTYKELESVKLLKKSMYSCQAVRFALLSDYVFGIDEKNLICKIERVILDNAINDESIKIQVSRYAENELVAKKMFNVREKFTERICGIMLGKYERINFQPEVVILQCNPWQVTRIIQAYLYKTGDNFHAVWNSNALPCGYGWYYTAITNKVNIVPPCSGSIAYGKFLASEFTVCIPSKDIAMIIENLDCTQAKGLTDPYLIDLGIPPKPPKEILA